MVAEGVKIQAVVAACGGRKRKGLPDRKGGGGLRQAFVVTVVVTGFMAGTN